MTVDTQAAQLLLIACAVHSTNTEKAALQVQASAVLNLVLPSTAEAIAPELLFFVGTEYIPLPGC